MNVLIYHYELEDGDFPDCCICCGAGDTVLTPIVLTSSIPLLGGSFQYQEVELPMCPAHVKPPLVALNYPGIREVTEEGIVVKNASSEFVDALEEHRERMRRRRQRRGEPEPSRRRVAREEPVPLSPERERAYRLFVIGLIVAVILAGAVTEGIVLLAGHR